MKNQSFNPIHKEHLNKLSEMAMFYEKYSIEFAHENGGEPNPKFSEIYDKIIEVSYNIMDVISFEVIESEFFNYKMEEVK